MEDQFIKKSCEGLYLSYYDLKILTVALQIFRHQDPYDKETDEAAKKICDEIVKFGRMMRRDV